MIRTEEIAKAFKELGHATRLMVFKRLVKAGEKGVSVGTLKDDLDIPNSTLSHHISSLVSAGLIMQKRDGKVLYCSVEYDKLLSVISFLQDECCIEDTK